MKNNKTASKYNENNIVYNDIEHQNVQPIFENLVWLNTLETAQFLRKKSTHAIRQLVYKGKLKPRKFEGRLYFNKLELESLIDSSHY